MEDYKCGKTSNGCSTLVEPDGSSVLILQMSFLCTFLCLCAFVSMRECVFALAALGKHAGVGVTAWQGTRLDLEVFDGQWRY